VEFKRADGPTITKSMRIAMQDLKLDAMYVVYPGFQRYPMGEGVEAVPLWAVMLSARENIYKRAKTNKKEAVEMTASLVVN
jgi:hypothetical protein